MDNTNQSQTNQSQTTESQSSQTQANTATNANQILQSAWATQIDSQTAQQFTGLSQVRMARANQLQREAASLTKAYGATDPGVLEVQASLQNEQTYASRLGVARDNTSTTAPTPPANGWALYGRVRNADLTPAPQLTVFLADRGRAWLKRYAYAFTDQNGNFTLSYTPPATGKQARHGKGGVAEAAEHLVDDAEVLLGDTPRSAAGRAAAALTAYVEVSNSTCKLVYVDATPISLATGAAVYRDIVLTGDGPLGTPPCEPGAPAPVPPARK
jgi:hypothetical protein